MVKSSDIHATTALRNSKHANTRAFGAHRRICCLRRSYIASSSVGSSLFAEHSTTKIGLMVTIPFGAGASFSASVRSSPRFESSAVRLIAAGMFDTSAGDWMVDLKAVRICGSARWTARNFAASTRFPKSDLKLMSKCTMTACVCSTWVAKEYQPDSRKYERGGG